MSSLDVLAHALRLQQQGEPFCLVSVLRVQAPASARPGDKAVVSGQRIEAGWIGGGCAQPAVLRTVKQALADGRSRLIRITPSDAGPQTASPSPPEGVGSSAEAGPSRAGTERTLQDVLEFGMACHSGGTLDLFVDPVLPRARLVVVGDSPLAAALAGLAPRVGLPATVVAHGADSVRFADAERVIASDDAAEVAAQVAPGAFVVVATQGRRDLQGLRAALGLQARQVFFVASARKAAVLRAALVEAGHAAEAVGAIVAPAGEPIGAQTPEEIALSVLATVVAARRGTSAPTGSARTEPVDHTHTDRAELVEAPAPRPQRVAPAAWPELPPIKGSCCGG
jgi:xanthine dehydrogenase accessory factor